MEQVTVEIIAVGNELLLGDVLDTNSNWLCRRLTGLGAIVRQVSQIPDDEEAIAEALRMALARGTRLVILSGGLGPTEDDRTLQGVARALGLEVHLDPLALEWVEAKYQELARLGYIAHAEITPSRAKMAYLPMGAQPLANGVGAAPGVLLELGSREGRKGTAPQAVVCLPGVPDELKDIFQGSLAPFLERLLGHSDYQEWKATLACGDESLLAPLLRDVSKAHPSVYVKSRARRFAPNQTFEVTLSARGAPDGPSATELLHAAWQDLERALHDAAVPVLRLEDGG